VRTFDEPRMPLPVWWRRRLGILRCRARRGVLRVSRGVRVFPVPGDGVWVGVRQGVCVSVRVYVAVGFQARGYGKLRHLLSGAVRLLQERAGWGGECAGKGSGNGSGS
jgi:hypothetical protein